MGSYQFPKRDKPKTGDLWYGDKRLEVDQAFPILQRKKKEYIQFGYNKDKLNIRYHNGKKY